MFYPKISRRNQYCSPHGRGGVFSDYRKYANEIAEDCNNRCVYCDATTSENLGGDAFQLDHFRPQRHFPHLECDPKNLVLACAACNRFKSDHWPAGKDADDTFIANAGFLDPFKDDRLEYFQIESNGQISSKRDPAAYMVRLLHLDRPARNNLRRRRILFEQIDALQGEISRKWESTTCAFEKDEIAKPEYLERIKYLQQLNDQLRSSFSELRI